MVAQPPIPKPTLTSRLIAWRRAYLALLEDLSPDPKDGYKHVAHVSDRALAADIAARLVVGADLEN
jgi:hypothetical protein